MGKAYTNTHNWFSMQLMLSVPYRPSDASLQLVDDAEVRAWLTSTFTRKDSLYEQPSQGLKRTFKAVADAVIIGQYLGWEAREETQL